MKLLVVDDHTLFRDGLRHVLCQLEDNVQILEAPTCTHALTMAAGEDDLDMVLLDLGLPDMDGFDALRLLHQRFPILPIVVLSASEEESDAQKSLTEGALGFIPKSSSGQVMLSALRLVFAGGVYLPPFLSHFGMASAAVSATAHKSNKSDTGSQGLTERQLDVLSLLRQGKSNKQIARVLGLTEGTVKVHLAAIFKVLNVTNRTEAVIAASGYATSPTYQHGQTP